MLKKKIYLDYMEIFITFVVGEAFELAQKLYHQTQWEKQNPHHSIIEQCGFAFFSSTSTRIRTGMLYSGRF